MASREASPIPRAVRGSAREAAPRAAVWRKVRRRMARGKRTTRLLHFPRGSQGTQGRRRGAARGTSRGRRLAARAHRGTCPGLVWFGAGTAGRRAGARPLAPRPHLGDGPGGRARVPVRRGRRGPLAPMKSALDAFGGAVHGAGSWAVGVSGAVGAASWPIPAAVILSGLVALLFGARARRPVAALGAAGAAAAAASWLGAPVGSALGLSPSMLAAWSAAGAGALAA